MRVTRVRKKFTWVSTETRRYINLEGTRVRYCYSSKRALTKARCEAIKSEMERFWRNQLPTVICIDYSSKKICYSSKLRPKMGVYNWSCSCSSKPKGYQVSTEKERKSNWFHTPTDIYRSTTARNL